MNASRLYGVFVLLHRQIGGQTILAIKDISLIVLEKQVFVCRVKLECYHDDDRTIVEQGQWNYD
ncbi:hypothetical protein EGI26_13410 [Lacihabitans sp. CCS-44]|uniref:hypothetical protein n=1 Tax=Lacihabitans sp. CCS-44 TaxID=2487331 RepID=UPI0020CF884F|nr:hypothetical protein [Lacihabitans sp. CCS-44]MCP9756154.1 hypothetical protein [Lacihabitans sp. CCS-44]